MPPNLKPYSQATDSASNDEFPAVSPEAIAALDRLFPLTPPKESDSDRAIWIAVGTRKVIDFLKSRQDETIEQALTSGKNTVIPKT